MEITGRWGAIHPTTTKLNQYPARYADGNAGCFVDWSGVTAVMRCLHPGCGEQYGPVFSKEEVAEAARAHRILAHAKSRRSVDKTTGLIAIQQYSSVPKEAHEEARRIAKTCAECGKEAKTMNGYCSLCVRRTRLAWAIELGELPEGARPRDMDALLRELRREANGYHQRLYAEYEKYTGDLTWPEWIEARRGA